MDIRFFEHPQIICGLPKSKKSLRFVKRRFKDSTLSQIFPNDDILLIEFEYFITIKLQLMMYVMDNSTTTTHDKLLEKMKIKKVIRPCRISTLIRFLLEDLNTLLLPAMHTDTILVICVDRLLKINPLTSSVEVLDMNTIINPETYIMMETNSI